MEENITRILKLKHGSKDFLLIYCRGEYSLWASAQRSFILVDNDLALDIIASELTTIVDNLNTEGD